MQKLNFSVIVTPACAADMEALLVGHVYVYRGQVFLQINVALGATSHAEVVLVAAGNIGGVVVPHPAYEGGLTAGPGIHSGGLLCIVVDELQAEFIYK